jgi:hypothetical protein
MAAEQAFTVRIHTMTGTTIKVPNVSMTTTVWNLKQMAALNLSDSAKASIGITNEYIPTSKIQLMYSTPRVREGFIELINGKLVEYGIDFFHPNTELKMLVGESKEIIYDDDVPDELETILDDSSNLKSISPNATIVREISPELNFKKIYILKNPNDKEGLPCIVKYISPTIESNNVIVIDPHTPDIRLLYSDFYVPNFLRPYVKNGRVLVEEYVIEEPVHGGRKKRTRRTRRRLFKKRTHRKYRRMSR